MMVCYDRYVDFSADEGYTESLGRRTDGCVGCHVSNGAVMGRCRYSCVGYDGQVDVQGCKNTDWCDGGQVEVRLCRAEDAVLVLMGTPYLVADPSLKSTGPGGFTSMGLARARRLAPPLRVGLTIMSLSPPSDPCLILHVEPALSLVCCKSLAGVCVLEQPVYCWHGPCARSLEHRLQQCAWI